MEFTDQYSAFTILGYGIIVFHDLELADKFKSRGPEKLYKLFGKTFCFARTYFK